MPDKVRLNKALNIIEVESYGIVTKQDISASIDKILAIQQETGIDKLLVDTTAQETLPDAFEILEDFSNYPRHIKTALLVRQSQATAGDVGFVETVALNRGKKIQLHHDRDEALRWLDS